MPPDFIRCLVLCCGIQLYVSGRFASLITPVIFFSPISQTACRVSIFAVSKMYDKVGLITDHLHLKLHKSTQSHIAYVNMLLGKLLGFYVLDQPSTLDKSVVCTQMLFYYGTVGLIV